MTKAVKTHVSNLSGEQRLYDVTLSRFWQMNQKAMDDEGHNWFGFESGYEKQKKLFFIGHHAPSVSEQAVAEHLRTAQQYLMQWQRVLSEPEGGIVPFTYQGVDFSVPTRGKAQSVPVTDWLDWVFMTIITGRYGDLNALMAQFGRGQVNCGEIFGSLHCEIILHLLGLQPSQDITAAIERLTQFIDEGDRAGRERWMIFHSITITLGFYDVMQAVHQQNQEAYRDAMHRALGMHKEWWTHDKDFSQRETGYVSLPLLTAAKYAKEKYGLTLDVESGYLPTYVFSNS